MESKIGKGLEQALVRQGPARWFAMGGCMDPDGVRHVFEIRRRRFLSYCRGNIDGCFFNFEFDHRWMPQLVCPIGNEPLHTLYSENRGQ